MLVHIWLVFFFKGGSQSKRNIPNRNIKKILSHFIFIMGRKQMFENIIIVVYNSEFHVGNAYFFFSERKKYDGITEKIRRPVKRKINKKKLMVTELLLKKKPI